mgnify:CR=1 FL=1
MIKNLNKKNVAIVGAGFTGLSAAHYLSKQGIKVTIFEAGSTEGGLASGFKLMGQPVERAYHFIYKTDKHMISLLEELKILDTLTFHQSSISTYYNKTLYPMVTPTDLLKFYPLNFFDRIRAGLTVLYLQKVKNWRKLTSVSAIDWLNKYAGKNVTKIIWEPLLKGKFDIYFDKVTMCWLWGRVKQRMDSQKAGASGEDLGYLSGGFDSVVQSLKSSILINEGKIKLNTSIDEIEYCDHSDCVKLLVDGKEELFDSVLLTVPSNIASSILNKYSSLDPNYFDSLCRTDYLDAAVMVFVSDQKISNFYWHNINDDSEFVVFLSLTNLIGTDSFDGKHVYYIGDYMTSDNQNMHIEKEELMDKWLKQLKEFFPNFDESCISEKHLFRFRNAQHIVDIGYEEKIPSMSTPCKNVYLSNFSQIFPMDRGTNYAVRDGKIASDLIISQLTDLDLSNV